MHHAEDRDLVFSRAEEDPPEGAHPPAGGPPQKADVEKAAGSEDFQALLLARKMSPNKLAENAELMGMVADQAQAETVDDNANKEYIKSTFHLDEHGFHKMQDRIEVCTLIWSMVMNVVNSFMTGICMYLLITTFTLDGTESATKAALSLVALYFMLDLDTRILDTDPALRPKYRRQVLRQTEIVTDADGQPYRPVFLLAIATGANALVHWFAPMSLLCVLFLNWTPV